MNRNAWVIRLAIILFFVVAAGMIVGSEWGRNDRSAATDRDPGAEASQKSKEHKAKDSGAPADGQGSGGFAHAPLFAEFFAADPSGHVFDDRLYIYPSHDVDTGVAPDNWGSHFDMRDYHVLSLGKPGGPVRDHGVALDVSQVAWAKKQMWAPDAAEKDGKYFLYFPAKDERGVFRIGVAQSESPAGPFVPEPRPIEGSYSIDPAVFRDVDGSYYLFFGGLRGGQLERYRTGSYREDGQPPPDEAPALAPQVALLTDDMLGLAEKPRDVRIVDETGAELRAGDRERRFFEAAFVHEFEGTYYFSYSTGDTHFIVYATGSSPDGPFEYRGRILEPVVGWTTHHSIVEFRGKWWLLYHDSQLSGGQTHLRNLKMTELVHQVDGTIATITP